MIKIRINFLIYIVSILVLTIFPNSTFADEEDEFDFGDDEELTEVETTVEQSDKFYEGKLQFTSGYQFGQPNRVMLFGPRLLGKYDRSFEHFQVYGEADYLHNFAYDLEDDSDYVKSRYQDMFFVRELYAKKAFNNSSWTLGQQIVVWSKGDLVPVLDLFTAKDQTQLFFVKPAQARVGQTGLNIENYYGKYEFNFWIAVAPKKDFIAAADHPYAQTYDFEVESEIDSGENEFGLRLERKIDSGSFSFITGRVHQRSPIFDEDDESIEEIYHEYNFYGATFEKIYGNILFKSEVVNKDKILTQELDDDIYTEGPEINEKAVMIGMDYNHQHYGSFIYESSYIHREEFEDRDVYGDGLVLFHAFAWSKAFLNDDLRLTVVEVLIKDFENSLFRLDGKYKINDEVSLSGQISFFESDPKHEVIAFLRELDRIDFSFDVSF